MYFRADPFIDMRFVLLQFFRASYFSIKVLSAFLSFGDVLASSWMSGLEHNLLLETEVRDWSRTTFQDWLGHWGLVLWFPVHWFFFFKMLNLFIFYLSAQYKEQVHCIINGNKWFWLNEFDCFQFYSSELHYLKIIKTIRWKRIKVFY